MSTVVVSNLLSPMILCFVLGWLAMRLGSDLKLPSGAFSLMSTYLLFSIGLKGGASLSGTPFRDAAVPLAGTIILGATIPFLVFALARRVGRMSIEDSASLAAHYASVSAVTFIACLAFLDATKIAYESYAAALVAIMEIPGILVALLLAKFGSRNAEQLRLGPAIHEVVTGKSIMLLGGGLMIGLCSGKPGLDKVAPFFVAPFAGVLCLFMLEMGLIAASRASEIRRVGVFLVCWAIVGPIILGAIGVLVGHWLGLSIGGKTILATLCASASYIAAPAAVRVALPNANPSLSLTPAVGITFPFNLAIGLPLYLAMAQQLP